MIRRTVYEIKKPAYRCIFGNYGYTDYFVDDVGFGICKTAAWSDRQNLWDQRDDGRDIVEFDRSAGEACKKAVS